MYLVSIVLQLYKKVSVGVTLCDQQPYMGTHVLSFLAVYSIFGTPWEPARSGWGISSALSKHWNLCKCSSSWPPLYIVSISQNWSVCSKLFKYYLQILCATKSSWQHCVLGTTTKYSAPHWTRQRHALATIIIDNKGKSWMKRVHGGVVSAMMTGTTVHFGP